MWWFTVERSSLIFNKPIQSDWGFILFKFQIMSTRKTYPNKNMNISNAVMPQNSLKNTIPATIALSVKNTKFVGTTIVDSNFCIAMFKYLKIQEIL